MSSSTTTGPSPELLEPPRALKSFIRCGQFRSTVNAATAGFVGRGFVLDRVQDLVSGAESQSGYVVIKGEPGIGKTAIASTLVVQHGYIHHFNIASANVRRCSSSWRACALS